MVEYCDAEKTLIEIWEGLYGHQDGCPLYKPGLRLDDGDDCDCTFEWDSGTIEWVAAAIESWLPREYEHN